MITAMGNCKTQENLTTVTGAVDNLESETQRSTAELEKCTKSVWCGWRFLSGNIIPASGYH